MEERWEKVRQIVREECERIEQRILAVLEKHGTKAKVSFIHGRWTGINEEQMRVWRDAYGSCDIEKELKLAASWIVSNPMLAPKSQFGRFLNTWLAKQQNVSSIRAIPTRNESQQPKTCAYCRAKSTGMVNGIQSCDAHFRDAMDQKPRAA